ncbi:MAG: aminopeptidase [Muribaculaceae bacterium]|nr:aminopeptidase [Muribaculaceae bacterium]MDE6009420.1 aminopeptidase [Muribaculaceae bacterium]MDE6791570.1 aminopeptidase [Muribaculaceae bacterium]
MKKLIYAAALALVCPLTAAATDMQAPAPEAKPDSTGFKFNDIKINPTTSVKDQNKSGTCWSFSGTSFLEDDVLRRGGDKNIDLSEMYTVRKCYIDKAKKYIRTHGNVNFAPGGSFADVINVVDTYGVVPEAVYDGLNYGEDKHVHGELNNALTAYLNAVLKNPNRKVSTAWLPGFIGILDAYLGPEPTEFTIDGKKYTPQSYAKELGLKGDDFISITSFTHHPFYKPFAIEIPDNWLWAESMNVPLDEMKATIDNALENGYTVAWGADVSEPGFKWAKGFAVLPEPKSEANLEGTELSRWVKLSDKERDKANSDINGPVKEINVTQESRQAGFDNYQTTDDHGMVIVGIAEDQNGNRFYKVKNSWDTNQIYDGYFYVSEPFLLAKTINVMVNKNAVPQAVAKKIGLK